MSATQAYSYMTETINFTQWSTVDLYVVVWTENTEAPNDLF